MTRPTTNAAPSPPSCSSPRAGGGSREEGYTLVEAVVALALVATIAGTVFAVYLVAARQVGAWQARFAATNAVHLVQHRLAADLRRANAVAVLPAEGASRDPDAPVPLVSDAALVLGAAGATGDAVQSSERVTYTTDGTTLLRDGRPLHGPELVLTGATVALFEVDEDGALVPAAPPAAAERRAPARATAHVEVDLAEVRLTFVRGGDTTAIQVRGAPRGPRPWPDD